jgi:integrase
MKRGNITKRGKESWQLKWDTGTLNGKRQTHYATVRGTYKDAQRELTNQLKATDDGSLSEPTRMTVGDFMRRWLDNAAGLSPKTLERYRELAERQIIPHLGSERLDGLKPDQIREWHGKLLRTVSAQTVLHAHRLLKCAVKHVAPAANAIAKCKPPKPDDREMKILTADQIADVRQKLQGNGLLPIVELALATGMRRGELLALRWGDVDLDAAALGVERSVEETRTGLRIKPPKTKRGRRNISLPPEAVSLLRAHKVQQMEIRIALGQGRPINETLVFGTIEGELLSPDNLSRDWRRICRAKKLPLVRFHDLRHTHASILIGKGVDILTISRRLGHYKPSVTLDTYGHLIKGADAAAAAAIASVLS